MPESGQSQGSYNPPGSDDGQAPLPSLQNMTPDKIKLLLMQIDPRLAEMNDQLHTMDGRDAVARHPETGQLIQGAADRIMQGRSQRGGAEVASQYPFGSNPAGQEMAQMASSRKGMMSDQDISSANGLGDLVNKTKFLPPDSYNPTMPHHSVGVEIGEPTLSTEGGSQAFDMLMKRLQEGGSAKYQSPYGGGGPT